MKSRLVGASRSSARSAWVICNPAAGFWDASEDLERALGYLSRRGWTLTVKETGGKGDAESLARRAAIEGLDAVIVAGGDGTISEAVNGLAGTEVALGVLPMGTANVWALEAGFLERAFLKPDLLAAARELCEGRTRRVDLGRMGDQFFLLWSGIGFDAEVLREIDSRAKQRLGAFHYLSVGLDRALSLPRRCATLLVDGEEIRGPIILVVVSNVRLYAGVARVAPGARVDDGLLDVCTFRGQGRLAVAQHLAWVLGKNLFEDTLLDYRQAREVRVNAEPPLPVQVDGDVAGVTPVTFGVAPGALRAIVASRGNRSLFGSEL